MSETRKKLSPLQIQQLNETQQTLGRARNVAAAAELEAQRVLSLIFDAHGIAQDAKAQLDETTGELVVLPADEPPALAIEK